MRIRIARTLSALTALGAAAACTDEVRSPTPLEPAAKPSLGAAQTNDGAPPGQGRGRKIPDQYIVTMRPGPQVASATTVAERAGVTPQRLYSYAINGFAARLTAAQVQQLARDPNVQSVVQDEEAYPVQDEAFPGTLQGGAVWGLDRTDQLSLPLNGLYQYTTRGLGVRVYILDTGIRTSHNEFDGAAVNRAVDGYDFIDNDAVAQDCNGHGTHVAGTVGGTTYGVAKAATLVGVRVFGCSGGSPYSTIIAAVDWVIADKIRRNTPAVVNMSLSGGQFDPMDAATNNLSAYGIVPVVAAGNNSGADACFSSPAAATTALTIGATNSTDSRAAFSNIGTCVDLFAPGESVVSSWWTSDGATAVLSGTSMATPHVAGMAALFLSANPSATPGLVGEVIRDGASIGYVINAGAGSPNLLLHKNNGRLITNATGVQPWNSYYYSTPAGTHQAWLRSTSGTGSCAKLYLDRWDPATATWLVASSSTSCSSSKTMSFTSTLTGRYWRWRVLNSSTTISPTDYEIFIRRP